MNRVEALALAEAGYMPWPEFYRLFDPPPPRPRARLRLAVDNTRAVVAAVVRTERARP